MREYQKKFTFGLVFIFLPFSFAIFIVREREKKIRDSGASAEFPLLSLRVFGSVKIRASEREIERERGGVRKKRVPILAHTPSLSLNSLLTRSNFHTSEDTSGN